MPPEDSKTGSRVGAAVPRASQREVLVVGREAPISAIATRFDHIWSLAGERRYIWPAVFVGGGLFLLGATTGKPLYALTPLMIVLFVLGVRIWREGTRLAAREFYEGYAVARRFNYSERMMLLASTPILAAGDKRRCEHYMEGPLPGVDGVSLGVARFLVETREHKHDRRRRPIPIVTSHDFTIAIVDLLRPATSLPGVFLTRSGGRFTKHDWLDLDALTPATVDDERLSEQCDLYVQPGCDRERLRTLMSADLQKTLADSRLDPGFEYSGGALVVYVPHTLGHPDEIDSLIDITTQISRRLLEAGEPLKAVDTSFSKAPPTGIRAFGPPPPATKPQLEPHLRAAPEPEPEPRTARGFGRASIPPPGS